MSAGNLLKPVAVLVAVLAAYGLLARRISGRFYLISSLIACLGVIAYSYNLEQAASGDLAYDSGTLDLAIDYRLDGPAPDPAIKIVEIDERSLAYMAVEFGRWPWPRQVFAETLALLVDEGATAIALNVMFSDPDKGNPESDEMFDLLAGELGPVAYPLIRLSAENDALSEIRAGMIPGSIVNSDDMGPKVAVLLPMFPGTHDKLGANNLLIDDDGLVRRSSRYLEEADFALPTLQGRLADLSGKSLAVPPDPQTNQFLLNWRNQGENYERISFSDVYRELVLEEDVGIPELKDSIIILGATAPGLAIFKGTALSPTTDDNEIIATAVDDLINNTGLQTVNVWIITVITCAFLLTLGFGLSKDLDDEVIDGLFLALEAVAVLVTVMSVSYTTYVFDLSMMIVSGAALFGVAQVHRYAEKNARRGVGWFRPKPNNDYQELVALEIVAEDTVKYFSLLEDKFGHNNVLLIERLIHEDSIFAEAMQNTEYALVFCSEADWQSWLGDGDSASLEAYRTVDKFQSGASDEIEGDKFRSILTRVAARCLEDYLKMRYGPASSR